MAFNFKGITCFGTKPHNLLLPNFGAAVTGPPITISCWVRVGYTFGGPDAGFREETDPNEPDYLGDDMCIVALSSSENSQKNKIILGYSSANFVSGVTCYTNYPGLDQFFGLCPGYGADALMTEYECGLFARDFGETGWKWYGGIDVIRKNTRLVKNRFYLKVVNDQGVFSTTANGPDYEYISTSDTIHVSAVIKGTPPYQRNLHLLGKTFTDNLNLGNSLVIGETSQNNSKVFIGGYATWNVYAVSSGNGSYYGIFKGDVSEIGIWNAELTDSELDALKKGVKPINIRTDNLVFYAPMIRDGIHDYAGGLTLDILTGSAATSGSISELNFFTFSGLTLHPRRYG